MTDGAKTHHEAVAAPWQKLCAEIERAMRAFAIGQLASNMAIVWSSDGFCYTISIEAEGKRHD